jgi:hypothetical protein
VESFIGTRSATGMSRITATEGPAKGLLLPEPEELKPESEESKRSMAEAVVVLGGGSG